jgi:hypothetical protein
MLGASRSQRVIFAKEPLPSATLARARFSCACDSGTCSSVGRALNAAAFPLLACEPTGGRYRIWIERSRVRVSPGSPNREQYVQEPGGPARIPSALVRWQQVARSCEKAFTDSQPTEVVGRTQEVAEVRELPREAPRLFGLPSPRSERKGWRGRVVDSERRHVGSHTGGGGQVRRAVCQLSPEGALPGGAGQASTARRRPAQAPAQVRATNGRSNLQDLLDDEGHRAEARVLSNALARVQEDRDEKSASRSARGEAKNAGARRCAHRCVLRSGGAVRRLAGGAAAVRSRHTSPARAEDGRLPFNCTRSSLTCSCFWRGSSVSRAAGKYDCVITCSAMSRDVAVNVTPHVVGATPTCAAEVRAEVGRLSNSQFESGRQGSKVPSDMLLGSNTSGDARVRFASCATCSTSIWASTGFDVGGDEVLIVLAGLARHEQPAKRICQRQRQLAPGCGLKRVGARGVRVSRRRQHTSWVAGALRPAAETRKLVEALPPAPRLSSLKTDYARERDTSSRLADRGSTPRMSTERRHGGGGDLRTGRGSLMKQRRSFFWPESEHPFSASLTRAYTPRAAFLEEAA